MPGTEPGDATGQPPVGQHRGGRPAAPHGPDQLERLVRTLTFAGWLALGGSLGLIAFQLDRVRQVGTSDSRFADVWDQRIEVLSFLMLPPNLIVLAPAVALATVAAWCTRRPEAWLTALVRLAAGIAVTMFVIGAVSIVSIAAREGDGPSDLDAVFLRLGGMSLAAALVVVCRLADRV